MKGRFAVTIPRGVIAVLLAALCAAGAHAEDATDAREYREKVSYGIGVNMGKSFRKDGVEVDPEQIIKGLKDSLAGEKLRIPEKELRKLMNSFQGELRQRAAINRRNAVVENRRKGEAFLAENRARDGVRELPGGVQYSVLKAGEGARPQDADLVTVNYRGTLLDGSEFDATEPGKPANLKVATLIAGWREALKAMPVGSRWQIVVPASQAYGERGVGTDIGPNETLLFDLELVAIAR